MGLKTLAVAVLAAAAISAPAGAAEAPGARAFVVWLYGHYPSPHGHEFESLGTQIGRVFHPSLIALIREDSRLAGGEVGALDGDPICDCQDDSGTRFAVTTVRAAGPARAVAAVIRHGTEGPRDIETITLDLALTDGHWRVYDVGTKDTPSLRAYLIKSNEEARKAR
ncbi:MAG TPA: hypothetical protein VGH15_06410 [Caulobacteraceae bacterium]|jgi:hypothetical protein